MNFLLIKQCNYFSAVYFKKELIRRAEEIKDYLYKINKNNNLNQIQ
jgi:hypothetical protein